jgi:hypothetical protein
MILGTLDELEKEELGWMYRAFFDSLSVYPTAFWQPLRLLIAQPSNPECP